MVPADSRKISRVPRYSGYHYASFSFIYRAITVYGSTFQLYSTNKQFCNFLNNLQIALKSPTTPSTQRLQSITCRGFRLFPFRSPLLWESLVYFLFVPLLRCFSSRAFLLLNYWFIQGFLRINSRGFPHSEFHGSRVFSTSPWLIAASHVLHRLSVPRHPPLALCSFTCA